jgi:tRNA modification GTPase
MATTKNTDFSTDTIAALATAPAPAGVAIVRVSGPRAKFALSAMFESKQLPAEHPRMLILGKVLQYPSEQVIDTALAVYMPGPDSFTGEDIVEFQLHGSLLIAQKVLASLFAFGVVPAQPGEFSRRAFLNGKMDLVQAEAVADLINATSEHALRIASEQLSGHLSQAVERVGEPLRNILAEIEAGIDFPEEDIEPEQERAILEKIRESENQVRQLFDSYRFGAKVKEGFRVLLCGAPNAGKSSLLNALLGRRRAIVTEISGTTRDLIEEEAIFDGFRFIFCDSAGIRETEDAVEKIGIELAKEKIAWADLVILVTDALDSTEQWQGVLAELRGKAAQVWMVVNKIDLNSSAIGNLFCDSRDCARNFYLSAKSGAGIQDLKEALVEEVVSKIGDSGEASQVITNERHRAALLRASDALFSAGHALETQQPMELVSAELRHALTALEEIVGKTFTEDILGRIFSKFCIGK